MYKDLRTKLKLLYIVYQGETWSSLWGLKLILFATKQEGECPRGFGFLIHKSKDLFFIESGLGAEKIVGYGLTLLCRPFKPFHIKWTTYG